MNDGKFYSQCFPYEVHVQRLSTRADKTCWSTSDATDTSVHIPKKFHIQS